MADGLQAPGAGEALRRRYEAGAETIAAIAATAGISDAALRRLAKREGWAPRKGSRPAGSVRSAGHGAPGPISGEDEAAALIARLTRACARQIEAFERRVPGAADDKDVQVLGHLTKNLEKLMEMATPLQNAGEHGGAADDDAIARELADRLERMLAGRSDRAGR